MSHRRVPFRPAARARSLVCVWVCVVLVAGFTACSDDSGASGYRAQELITPGSVLTNVDGDNSGDPDILLVRSPEGADLASIATQLYERPLFTTGGPRGTSFLWVDPGAPSLRSVDGSGKEVASVDVKSALGDERTGYCDDIAIAPTDAPNADTVLICNEAVRAVAMVAPDGAVQPIDVGLSAVIVGFAPAGTPTTGTAFLIARKKGTRDAAVFAIIPPESTEATLIDATFDVLPAIIPADLPNAGGVYLADLNDSCKLTLLAPTNLAEPQCVVRKARGTGPVLAPPGTPNAGTVHLFSRDGIEVIGEDFATRSVALQTSGDLRPASAVIAPAGTPAEGTVYVLSEQSSAGVNPVYALKPDGTTLDPVFSFGEDAPWEVIVVGDGSANAGNLVVYDREKVVVARPGGTTAATITLPETDLSVSLDVVVAPANTPNAGTTYVLLGADTGKTGLLWEIRPDDTVSGPTEIGFVNEEGFTPRSWLVIAPE